eukprot:1321268-Amorphochlora_amoeboformis.AAC.1
MALVIPGGTPLGGGQTDELFLSLSPNGISRLLQRQSPRVCLVSPMSDTNQDNKTKPDEKLQNHVKEEKGAHAPPSLPPLPTFCTITPRMKLYARLSRSFQPSSLSGPSVTRGNPCKWSPWKTQYDFPRLIIQNSRNRPAQPRTWPRCQRLAARLTPLLSSHSGEDKKGRKVVVVEENLEQIVKNVEATGVQKLYIVSLVGAMRTGKSFMLDLFLRYLTEPRKSTSYPKPKFMHLVSAQTS